MKRTILLAILGCLLASPAFATDTRVSSMGGKEKGWTVFDEVNIHYFPATVLAFPNVVYGDVGLAPAWAIGDADGSSVPYNVGFGAHVAFGDNDVLAFYGSSMSRALADGALSRVFERAGKWAPVVSEDEFTTDEVSGSQAINNADHLGTLVYGHRFGAARTGVALSLFSDSYSVESPETSHRSRGATMFEGKLGFGYDLARDASFDFGLVIQSGTFSDEKFVTSGVVTRLKSDPFFGMDLYARGIFNAGTEKVIPYLNLGFENGGVAWNAPNGTKTEFNRFHLVAGVDMRIQPLENVFIYPGVGVAVMTDKVSEGVGSANETIQDELTLVAPFVGAAVDARVAKWFSVRFGLRQSVFFSSLYHDSDGVAQGNDNETLTEFTLGAGLHFGPVDIEWMVNPAFFMEGFLSGDDGDRVVLVQDLDGDGVADTPVDGEPTYGDGFASQLAVKFTW